MTGTLSVTDGTTTVSTAVTANGTYHLDVTSLADGPITASFSATDSNGNPESASTTATLDTDATETVSLAAAPVINAAAAPTAAFTVAGLDDAVTGTLSVTDGTTTVSTAVTANGTYHLDVTSLADGPITASFSATDSNGNPESASTTATLDTDATETVSLAAAPVINAAAAPTAAFTVAGLDDAVTGTLSVTDGTTTVSTAVTANGTYHLDVTSLADGPITASFSATDSNGNPESASTTATLDTDATETVSLAAAPVINAAAAPTAAFTVAGLDDAVTGTLSVTDGTTTVSTAVTANGTYHLDVTSLADGPITASFSATNSNGNPESASTTATLDTTAPAAPAGVAGDPINLALANPAAADGGPVAVTITGVPSKRT